MKREKRASVHTLVLVPMCIAFAIAFGLQALASSSRNDVTIDPPPDVRHTAAKKEKQWTRTSDSYYETGFGTSRGYSADSGLFDSNRTLLEQVMPTNHSSGADYLR